MIISLACSIIGCTRSTSSESVDDYILQSSAIELVTADNYDPHEDYEIIPYSYDSIDCDFTIDTTNHHIKANYVYGDIIIDYDMPYFDYGVKEAGIYSAKSNGPATKYSLDTGDEWKEVVIDTYHFFRVAITSRERMDVVLNSLGSFDCITINDDERLEQLIKCIGDYMDVFPYANKFAYDMSEYKNRAADDVYISVFSPFTIYTNKLSEDSNLTKLTIRENLDGLPIGYLVDNSNSTFRRIYGDYYGGIAGKEDIWLDDFYSVDYETAIDVVYYNFGQFALVEDKASIVPIEDCIQNTIPEIIDSGINHYYVYGAELTYVPFSIGRNGFVDAATNVVFVPVWAVYYVKDVSYGYIDSSTVFINAYTGKLLDKYV